VSALALAAVAAGPRRSLKSTVPGNGGATRLSRTLYEMMTGIRASRRPWAVSAESSQQGLTRGAPETNTAAVQNEVGITKRLAGRRLLVRGDKSSHRALILGAAARGRQTIDGIATPPTFARPWKRSARWDFVESMPDGRTIVLASSLARIRHRRRELRYHRASVAVLRRRRAAAAHRRGRSLRKRPMGRVAALSGWAPALPANGGTLPVIEGGSCANPLQMPVPAQVKSAILTPASSRKDTIVSNLPTRITLDHVAAMGADIACNGGTRAAASP
jgi:5-enolpyruvylshikimate-3-phosphate synthase